MNQIHVETKNNFIGYTNKHTQSMMVYDQSQIKQNYSQEKCFGFASLKTR